MTDPARVTPADPAEPAALSSVKIETNSKGMAQVRVSMYDGVTEAEAQRLMNLAILTYETTNNRLGARANFS